MSVAITQEMSAGFTDVNIQSMGLLVDMQLGNDSKYLAFDCTSAMSRINTRVMFSGGTACGGVVTILRGLSGSGDEVFRVDYESDSRGVIFVMADGDELSSTLPSQLDWHCVEVECDLLMDIVRLYVNGISAGEATGSYSQLTVSEIWCGAMFKETNAVGQFKLDDWIIADQYIGPVIVDPASEHADDAARWLVVYNRDSADSLIWADDYREARNIPYANLLGIAAGPSETISETACNGILDRINDYLELNGLDEQVIGIVIGHAMPGYVQVSEQLHSLPAIAAAGGIIAEAVTNPVAGDSQMTRPTAQTLKPYRMTARIDGVTVAASQGLVDRAVALETGGMGHGDLASIYLQPHEQPLGNRQEVIDSMRHWGTSIDRMRTRLPYRLSDETPGPAPTEETPFTSISSDGFYWGWSSQQPCEGFFGKPAGMRIFYYPINDIEATATTLHSAEPANRIEKALAAGYCAAVGSSQACDSDSTLSIQVFFEALWSGWSLGEAWFTAQPRLDNGLYLVGDPLTKINFPQTGWDIFGPAKALSQIDWDTPMASLREGEQQWQIDSDHWPGYLEQGFYVVRHIDEAGQPELSLQCVSIINLNVTPGIKPLAPIWPMADGWPVILENGEVQLEIHWEKMLADCDVAHIELDGEIDGGAAQTLSALTPELQACQVSLVQPQPPTSARYRWRLISHDGASTVTPWSEHVYRVNRNSVTLKQTED